MARLKAEMSSLVIEANNDHNNDKLASSNKFQTHMDQTIMSKCL